MGVRPLAKFFFLRRLATADHAFTTMRQLKFHEQKLLKKCVGRWWLYELTRQA